jgi:DNA-directed RNA polymerase specialized sigma subunit
MPREIAEFHWAVMSMDESCRAVVEVVYRTKAGRDEKAEMLGISKSRMYQLLDQAHGYLAGRLDSTAKDVSRLSNNYTAQTVK